MSLVTTERKGEMKNINLVDKIELGLFNYSKADHLKIELTKREKEELVLSKNAFKC